MSCVQWNREVQTFSPHRSNHPFTDGIRNWRPHRCFDYMQPHVAHTLIDLFGENGIAVVDQEAIAVIGWNGFAELLRGPLGCGMHRDIDVKKSATLMLDDHKDIEQSECGSDRDAEVACDNAFGMIADKGGPALRLTAFARAANAVPRHILAHRSR
jgi:hypothetical protein